MNKISRRKLITGGLAATAGVSGLTAAALLAERYGLIPPDHGGIYGPGYHADLRRPTASDEALVGARVSAQHDFQNAFCQRDPGSEG